MKRLMHTKTLTILSLSILLILPFLLDTWENIAQGTIAILIHPSLLISDYLRIGGLGASLLNVALLMLMNVILLALLKLKLTGPIFAGLLTIAGFAFFGKNPLNIVPIYVGILLSAKFQKVDFRSLIIVLLFSTGIAPIVSYLLFGTGWPLLYAIPSAVVIGLLTGFLLPIMSVHMLRFHKGYNLYNVGFTMGILSFLYSAILRGVFKLNLFAFDSSTSEAYHHEMLILAIVVSVLLIVGGFISDPRALKKYPIILKSSGRLASDFMRDAGKEITFINAGVMGIISVIFCLVLGININGPVMSGILTVIGFGAFGKHPKNSLPVMLGATIWFIITKETTGSVSTGLAIGVLFVTAVAPVAGRHGFLVGLLAGFIHVLFTPLTYPFQGGFDLYNNGFAAGFVAAIIVPIFDVIRKNKIQEDMS